MSSQVEVRFMGHACIYIRTPNVSVVADPWFTPRGAYLASWFQFPDNTELDLEPLRNVDYVVLSHEHTDHFDLEFLRTVSPKAKILIAAFPDRWLEQELRRELPHEVIVVEDRKHLELAPDLGFCSIVQSVPIWDDSTMVFETPLGTILNTNDMKVTGPDLAWILERYRPDFLFAQFSGANWHPMAYENYTHAEKAAIAQTRVRTKIESVMRLFKATGARWFVPCAGPPCFLDDELFGLNFTDASIFPTQADFHAMAVEAGLGDRTLLALPGDPIDPAADVAAQNARVLASPPFADRRAYLESYRARRRAYVAEVLGQYPDPGRSLLEDARRYFEPLVKSSPYMREQLAGVLMLDVKGLHPERIVIDFTRPEGSVRPWAGEKCFYELRLEARFFHAILRREVTWEQLLLGLRFTAKREPDVYNEHLVTFLRFANPTSYRALQKYDRAKKLEETFDLVHEGVSYRVQRYCPHAMADLMRGTVEGDHIVCPGHAWRFSLADGKCDSNGLRIGVECVGGRRRKLPAVAELVPAESIVVPRSPAAVEGIQLPPAPRSPQVASEP